MDNKNVIIINDIDNGEQNIDNDEQNIDSNIFLKDLIDNQLHDVNLYKKLYYNDLKRISKFINSSIFNKNKCSLWTGYITNKNNMKRGTYINFYFNKKKIALHRLLYLNYIGNITKNEYIKFNCVNKGRCCNINHMIKYMYEINETNTMINSSTNNSITIDDDKKDLTLEI